MAAYSHMSEYDATYNGYCSDCKYYEPCPCGCGLGYCSILIFDGFFRGDEWFDECVWGEEKVQ